MKRAYIFPRFCTLILLAGTCLLTTRCADKVKLSRAALPPPRPVSYSGAAPDSAWLNDQTAAYMKQGVPESTAELTARMEYERQKTGDTKPFLAKITATPMGPEKQIQNRKSGKGAGQFFTPNLPPPPVPTVAPTPVPQDAPAIVHTIPVAPAVDNSTTTTTTTTETPMVPPPPQ